MYKKIFFLFVCLAAFTSTFAQKANIQSAINYLKDNDIANAKKMIDEACANEATKTNAKAWLVKAVVYQAIGTSKDMMPMLQFILNEKPYMLDLANANTLASSTPNALGEAVEAYKKSISFDSKYEKEEVAPLLTSILFVTYNNGINKMNDNKFADAYTVFGQVGELAQIDNGNLWKGNASLDSIFASSKMYQANCAYNTNKDDEAIGLIEECIKNPITQTPDMYIMLNELYGKKSNDAKWTETMAAARAKFPNDKRILNNEINYYLDKGRAEESINKLKEGIALEPQKADLYLLLGQTYLGMANPTDKSGKPIARPANAKELEQNAITNYTKAAELDPKNAYAPFNMGLIHFNNAKGINDEMNKTVDNKKYESLKPQRDGLIGQALPLFVKAKGLIEVEKINDSNRTMYRELLTGMMNCYNILNQAEKADEIKKLIDKK